MNLMTLTCININCRVVQFKGSTIVPLSHCPVCCMLGVAVHTPYQIADDDKGL